MAENKGPPDDETPAHAVFAQNLLSALEAKGMSQSDLARATRISRNAISTYVTGKFLPTPQTLAKLADALSVAPQALLPPQIERGSRAPSRPRGQDTASLLRGEPFVRTPIRELSGVERITVVRAVSKATADAVEHLLANDTGVVEKALEFYLQRLTKGENNV